MISKLNMERILEGAQRYFLFAPSPFSFYMGVCIDSGTDCGPAVKQTQGRESSPTDRRKSRPTKGPWMMMGYDVRFY